MADPEGSAMQGKKEGGTLPDFRPLPQVSSRHTFQSLSGSAEAELIQAVQLGPFSLSQLGQDLMGLPESQPQARKGKRAKLPHPDRFHLSGSGEALEGLP